jgi:hypothetical protein
MHLRFDNAMHSVIPSRDLQELELIEQHGDRERRQFSALYTDNAYNHMLLTQDRKIGDYTLRDSSTISRTQRWEMIELIDTLCKSKQYKSETFHIAVSIFDRYAAHRVQLNKCQPDLC